MKRHVVKWKSETVEIAQSAVTAERWTKRLQRETIDALRSKIYTVRKKRPKH